MRPATHAGWWEGVFAECDVLQNCVKLAGAAIRRA